MKRTRNVAWTLILLGIFAATGCRVDPDRIIPVRDGDRNIYTTRIIGSQKWLGSNLRTTRFNDGTAIPLIADSLAWSVQLKPAYCWLMNDQSNAINYGALYNYYALDTAVNGGKNICPVGWHVPTWDEWETLIRHVGGFNAAPYYLKVAGFNAWDDLDIKDPYMFSAWPAGFRSSWAGFGTWGVSMWWTSTQNSVGQATLVYIADGHDEIKNHKYEKRTGASLRCIED